MHEQAVQHSMNVKYTYLNISPGLILLYDINTLQMQKCVNLSPLSVLSELALNA